MSWHAMSIPVGCATGCNCCKKSHLDKDLEKPLTQRVRVIICKRQRKDFGKHRPPLGDANVSPKREELDYEESRSQAVAGDWNSGYVVICGVDSEATRQWQEQGLRLS